MDAERREFPAEDQALILATVTMHYEGDFFYGVGFYFEQVDGRRRFRLDSAVPWTIQPMLESTPDEGFEDVNGLLYAFLAPAGTWEMFRVQLHSVPPRMSITSTPVRFEVDPGSIVYLGNLHVDLCHYLPAGDPTYVMGGLATVIDNSDRDFPAFFARYPYLRDARIEKRILNGDEVRNTFRGLADDCP